MFHVGVVGNAWTRSSSRPTGAHAGEAVRRAIDLAAEHAAALAALAVVDTRIHGEPRLSAKELLTIETEDQFTECVADIEQRANAADVPVACVVRHGVSHERILGYADEVDADRVVVGVHGDHGTRIGPVGRRALEASDRDVELVERPPALWW